MNYIALAKATAPEIWMTVLALGVLLLDAVKLREWDIPRRVKWLGTITALGLVIALWLMLRQFGKLGANAELLFADSQGVLVISGLALVMKFLVVLLTIGTVILSIGYDSSRHVGEYFCLLIFTAIGMNFVITTENLLMFFVALELLSICLYILTGLHKGLVRSAEGAMKYFMFGALSSAFLLFGLSYLAGLTGSVRLDVMGEVVRNTMATGSGPASSWLLVIGMLFVIVGLGFKIAVVPFHLWAPDAYEGAPTPVAAFIATGSKVASFFIAGKILLTGLQGVAGEALINLRETTRGIMALATGDYTHLASGIQFSGGWMVILAVVASASMIWGNVAAIQQRNVKRLLAYSSIAHAGYILIGVIAANQMGSTAVLFYLVIYSLTNLGAFGVVAALTRAAGGDDLEDLNGMSQRAPFLSFWMLIFILSLAGIPPLAGFFGKFYLFAAAVQADPHNLGLLWLVVIAIVTSAISLYYYLILLKHIYVLPPRISDRVESPAHWRWTIFVLGMAVIGFGVCPQGLAEFLDMLSQSGGWVFAQR